MQKVKNFLAKHVRSEKPSKRKGSKFPEPGTVYVMPLKNGRLGVCRVVRLAIPKHCKTVMALVAASNWIGDNDPLMEDPAIRRILVLNHHSWKNSRKLIWVNTPPPNDFRKIGVIKVLPEDNQLDSYSHSNWDSLPFQVLAQWRWDNERAAVIEEDNLKLQKDKAQREEAARARASYLASVSFVELLAKDLFPRWGGLPPAPAKESTQRIITSLIQTLKEGPNPLTQKFVTQQLKKCVVELNQLDKKLRFIETVERDDLYVVLEEILYAAKFPDLCESIDEWRKW